METTINRGGNFSIRGTGPRTIGKSLALRRSAHREGKLSLAWPIRRGHVNFSKKWGRLTISKNLVMLIFQWEAVLLDCTFFLFWCYGETEGGSARSRKKPMEYIMLFIMIVQAVVAIIQVLKD